MNTYKFEGFRVGNIINAEDFESRPGRGDCFVEGKILAVVRDGSPQHPYAHYLILVDRDVWDGKRVPTDSRIGQTVAVPMESSMDWDERVTLVTWR